MNYKPTSGNNKESVDVDTMFQKPKNLEEEIEFMKSYFVMAKPEQLGVEGEDGGQRERIQNC